MVLVLSPWSVLVLGLGPWSKVQDLDRSALCRDPGQRTTNGLRTKGPWTKDAVRRTRPSSAVFHIVNPELPGASGRCVDGVDHEQDVPHLAHRQSTLRCRIDGPHVVEEHHDWPGGSVEVHRPSPPAAVLQPELNRQSHRSIGPGREHQPIVRRQCVAGGHRNRRIRRLGSRPANRPPQQELRSADRPRDIESRFRSWTRFDPPAPRFPILVLRRARCGVAALFRLIVASADIDRVRQHPGHRRIAWSARHLNLDPIHRASCRNDQLQPAIGGRRGSLSVLDQNNPAAWRTVVSTCNSMSPSAGGMMSPAIQVAAPRRAVKLRHPVSRWHRRLSRRDRSESPRGAPRYPQPHRV